MLASIRSATVVGVEGRPVVVEVHVSLGLPTFSVVGLPDEACREARDRARAAVLSSGLEWPNRRITVNLAPSGIRKAGSGLDLAIAVGVLVASDQVPAEAVDRLGFIAELGLDGRLRSVPGVAPMVYAIGDTDHVVVAPESYREANGISAGARVACTLIDVVEAAGKNVDVVVVPRVEVEAELEVCLLWVGVQLRKRPRTTQGTVEHIHPAYTSHLGSESV